MGFHTVMFLGTAPVGSLVLGALAERFGAPGGGARLGHRVLARGRLARHPAPPPGPARGPGRRPPFPEEGASVELTGQFWPARRSRPDPAMRDDKRQRILAAATAVFAERDFHRVQVSEVAYARRRRQGHGLPLLPDQGRPAPGGARGEPRAARRARSRRPPARGGRSTTRSRAIVLGILRFFWRRQHLLTLVQRYEQRSARRARERRHRVLERGRAASWRATAWRRAGRLAASDAALPPRPLARGDPRARGRRPAGGARRRAIVDVYLHGARRPPARPRGSGARHEAARGHAPLASRWRSRRCRRRAAGARRREAPGGDGRRPEPITVTVANVGRPAGRAHGLGGRHARRQRAGRAGERDRGPGGRRRRRPRRPRDARAGPRARPQRRDRGAAPRGRGEPREGRRRRGARARRCATRASSRRRSTSRCAPALEVARARRDRLRIELEHADIRAPFDGSVAGAPRRRRATTCAPARSSSGSCRTIRSSSAARCPSARCRRSRPGRRCASRVDAVSRARRSSGRSRAIGAASDPTARSLTFEAVVPNADHRLRPGFFGHGEVVVAHGRARARRAARRAHARSPA